MTEPQKRAVRKAIEAHSRLTVGSKLAEVKVVEFSIPLIVLLQIHASKWSPLGWF